MTRSLGAFLALGALLFLSAPALAQDEFLINDDRVDRDQWAPRVARGPTGTLVVAWMDGRNVIGNVVDFDAYIMTIRDPQALGSTVNRRLNDDPAGKDQRYPDVAASPAGTFLCVWEDSRAGNRDIYAAALDSIGVRITPNLRLNDDASFREQANPQVISVGSDRFLVVWGDQREGQSEIFASYITASGAPIGANIKISVDPVVDGSYQGEPALAASEDGTTLIAWLDGREGGAVFGVTFDVYAQWIGPAGIPVGGNFKINDTVGPQRNTSVAVAADATQGFVAGWIDRRGFPADPGDVYAERFDSNRSAIGANVRVNDDPPGRDQRSLRAVPTPGIAYLLWEDLRGNLGIDSNVEAAPVSYNASTPGANFRVNGSIPSRQGTPGATWDGRDAMLAVWEDGRNGSPDIYAISIFPGGARRGSETQLNDDAAPGDQLRPRLGRGRGRYISTWTDRRAGTDDLFGQWITAAGGRDGPNHRVWKDDGVNRPVAADAAVSPAGPGLVVAHVTRDSDAGEIKGFLYTSVGSAPASAFWISDSLPSAQSTPSATATASGFAIAWLDTRDGAPRVYGQLVGLDGARVGANHAILGADPADPVFDLDLDEDPLGGYWLCFAEGIEIDQRLWIVHLDAALVADRTPIEVAASMGGERSHPALGVGPDGRVEVVWLGDLPGTLGQVYQEGFSPAGAPLGPAYALRIPGGATAEAAPNISVSAGFSIVTWEAKQDGNWSIWIQVFLGGAEPSSGSVRVDQDVVGADQLNPTSGLDASGRVVVVWSDGRSASSGTDIVGRVFNFGTTSVTEPPEPPSTPEPPPSNPPQTLRVGPPRPNPFSGTVGLRVEPRPGTGTRVTVRVVNVRGEVVSTLHDGPLDSRGIDLRWDGTDSRSRAAAASGVYWIVTDAGGERRALRVVQLR